MKQYIDLVSAISPKGMQNDITVSTRLQYFPQATLLRLSLFFTLPKMEKLLTNVQILIESGISVKITSGDCRRSKPHS